MSAQLEIAGHLIELDQQIKYTFQVNDIAEIKDRQASYTSRFKLPRTKTLTRLFRGLGLIGDTSLKPYEKITIRLLDHYIPVIASGWLVIQKTDAHYYHVAVYSGVIDFFKAIENKTLGNHLNLSQINHQKDVPTVIASWQNDLPYRYLVADYNGKMTYSPLQSIASQPLINIDYLVPAISVPYLWDKIFDTFGFTYKGNIFGYPDFQQLKITFPKGPADINEIVVAEVEKTSYSDFAGPFQEAAPYTQWDTLLTPLDPQYVTLSPDGTSLQIQKTGNYKIYTELVGEATYFPHTNLQLGRLIDDTFQTIISKNAGYHILAQLESTKSPSGYQPGLHQPLNEGDSITFRLARKSQYSTKYPYHINNFMRHRFKLVYVASNVSPTLELASFPIKDFIKEILWRFSLTPFVEPYTRTLHFLTLSERLTTERITNASKWYAGRIAESYIYGYAKQNWLKAKYVEEGQDHSDVSIPVENENLKDAKTLINSKIYAPEPFLTSLPINPNYTEQLPVLPFWEKQTQENQGEVTTNYKPLKNAYYFLRERERTEEITVGSETFVNSAQVHDGYYIASTDNTSWAYWVDQYYPNFATILSDTRLHEIQLALTPIDMHGLDFKALYYFEQEASYYLLNKLNFESGKLAKAEFIRVKLNRTLGAFSDDFSNAFDI